MTLGIILYIKVNLCVCVCVRYRNTHCWTNPHQIWHGGLTLQGPGLRLCFGPWGQRGPKQGLESMYRLNHETRQKFYKTKFVGKVCFSGGRSYFWAHNPDLEGPGPHVLLEPWSIIFGQILLYKSSHVKR
jgi:hypothetical protein